MSSASTAVADTLCHIQKEKPVSVIEGIQYNTLTRGAAVEPPDGEVTELLALAGAGSDEAREKLFKLIFPKLLDMAAIRMRRERPGHSLSSRDLVNEAFLRLANQHSLQRNRAQLYGVFAIMIRRILVDRAKKRNAEIHGGGWLRVDLHPNLSLPPQQEEQVLAIHECLERLERENPRQGKIVELRFFGGLSNAEIAEQMGISLSTVESDWRFARAWLRTELEGAGGDQSSSKRVRPEAV